MTIKLKAMFLASTIMTAAPRAFDPGKAGGWKVVDGKIEMKDGNPIWINGDGSEVTMGGDTISRLNGEAKTNRERAEKAEGIVATFKDIDPDTARKAIETVKKIDAKKLIDSGEVDKLTDQIKATFATQLAEKDAAIAQGQQRIDNMAVDTMFAQSQFISDSVAMPRDFFTAAMRQHVKVKDGKIEMVDKAGNPVWSKKKAGEMADPDEALAIIVDSHPQKATILKANGHSGSGGSNGGGSGGKRTIARVDFDKLPPAQQAAEAALAGKGEVTILD